MTPQEVRDRHHGHPFEVVIPCMTLEEANAEKADLHAAAEARAFIRPTGAGGVLDRDQARAVLDALAPHAYGYEIDAALDALAGCVRPVAGVILTPAEAALAAEVLHIGQDYLDDYADQFSDVDARLDEGKTRTAAAGMRALAARLEAAS